MPTLDPRPLQHTDLLRRQMAQFFEATTDAIFFLDREYRFTFLNSRAQELIAFGEDLTGLNLYEHFPASVYEGSPFVENYTRAMDGTPSAFEAFYPEPINKWFRIHAYPTDGGMVVFFRDLSEEKAAREAIDRKTAEAQRQHAELETIYRTAPIGLALFDLDGYHYLRLNDHQAAFFGLKPEQVVGKTLTEMAPVPGLRELFDQVASGGPPVVNYPLEGALVTDPVGEHRYWTVNYFPVHGPDGAIQAITAASLEVTAQKKAEIALRESEKLAAVGRLASSIAHEINNPLESMTNLLYLAEFSESLEETRDFIRAAEVELRRVSAITTQTLRFHKQSTSPQEIGVDELIGSVLAVFQGRILNSSIAIERKDAPGLRIRCFEGEIRQVLSNLISNSLDAMPHGGRLLVRSHAATDWSTGEHGVTLTVADTGAGMSRETQTRLFNPFFTTKGIIGTGLGLWVSKEIVDRHRGHLHLRSCQHPILHGTVFTLFLPLDAAVR